MQCTYFSHLSGLDGKDLMEQCLADGVNDALTDILNAQVKYAFAPDDATKVSFHTIIMLGTVDMIITCS